jgi:2-polyprenyl-6-methoxyphenol hydroxylase-like FAD-dependent oxidoreductase
MENLHVAVIGAGIGGLCAAVALSRRGIRVTVLEQASELKPSGASIDVGPNAIRLLDALDLGAAVRAVSVRPDTIELVRWEDGTCLLSAPHGAAAEAHFGAPLLDVLRPDLHLVLADALAPDTIALDSQVDDVVEKNGSAAAVLADGRRIDADVIVAADGIRSTIRQRLVGSDDPVFSGTVVYRGVVPREHVAELQPPRLNRYWLGPRRHAVAYWIAAGRLLAVNAAIQEADWARESWTDEAPKSEVLPYFEGWHEPLLERFRQTDSFLRGAVFVRRPLDHWSFGRITLLGDAAHAMEPFQAQGAAQAIEDAFVLAECLAAVERDGVADALRRYENVRMSRAAELQASSSSAAGRFYLPDGEEQQARDAEYRTLLDRLPWGHRQPIWEYDVRDALGTVDE